MKRILFGLILALVGMDCVVAREPTFVRSKHLIGLRFNFTNVESLSASLGSVVLNETGVSDSTPRTSAMLYTSLEPGRTYLLVVSWSSESPYPYTGSFSAECFSEPGEEVFVNQVPHAKIQGSAYHDPSDPTVTNTIWEIRLGSTLAVSPGIGQSGSLALGETSWSVSLGRGATGMALDPLTLAPNWAQSNGLSLAKLTAPRGGEVIAVDAPVGELRQVLVPQALVDLTPISQGFEAKFYPRSAITGMSGNLYTLAGNATPFITHRLIRPQASGQQLSHTRIVGTDLETTEINPLGSNSWRRTGPEGLVIEERSQVVNGSGNIEELRSIKGSNQVVVQESLLEYHDFPWGREVVRRVDDPTAAALTTFYSFYDDPAQPANYGRLRHVRTPDGNWTRYDYILTGPSTGRLQRTLRPWLDAPAHPDSASLGNCSATTLSYVADWNGVVRLVGESVESVLGVTVGRTVTQWAFPVQLVTFSIDWGAPQVLSNQATTLRYSGAAEAPQTSTVVSIRPAAFTPPSFWEKPLQVTSPEGITTNVLYGTGTWNQATGEFVPNNSYNGPGMDQIEYRTPTLIVQQKSIRTIEVRVSGQVALSAKYVWDNPPTEPQQNPGWQILATEEAMFSPAMKPTWRQRGPRYFWDTGAAWTGTYSADGRLASERSEQGIETIYVYDAIGRQVRKTIKGVPAPSYTTLFGGSPQTVTLPAVLDRVAEYRYDAANRVIEEKVVGSSESLTTSHVFDKAGRRVQSQVPGPAGPLTTTHTYLPLSGGGWQVTTTAPDGGTVISKTHRDGKTFAAEGTAQVTRQWTWQVAVDGRLNSTVSEGPRWTTTTTDWLGRTVASSRPDTLGGTFVESQVYNAAGQLTSTASSFPGSKPTRYVYGSLGELVMKGLDLDNNGTLDAASSDRIEAYDTRYSFISPYSGYLSAVQVDTTSQYAVAGSSVATVARTRKTQVGWWQPITMSWETTSGDLGEMTRATSAAGGVSWTGVQAATPQLVIQAAGLTLRTITGAVTTSFQYDDCGRLITSTDARRGDTEFTYFANSAVQSAMIDPADLAANRITEAYQYNSGGRRIATVDALGRTRRLEYDFHGRVVKEWGSAAYPVERIYCSCGKIAELKTYRAGTGWSGVSWPSGTAGTFDKTTWTYGPTTGLLMAKTDANTAAVTYGYDSAGRMTTRTWARGVVTNYGYDAATGELLSTTYSDATPAVTHTFNRLGRLTTVTDGTGSRTFTYTTHGQLATEALNVTGFGSTSSSFAYDNSLRRVSATVAGFHVAYHYEDLGRLSFVHSYSSGWSSLGNYRFNYLANSNLLSSVSNGTGYSIGTALQVFTWSPHRNDLVSLSNEGMDPGSTNALRFNYVRDALSRITQETRVLDGQSTPPWATRTFAYNDRSELTTVTGEAESYVYDAQGNRQTGNGVNYQANALNQYATVGGVTWTYDADGNPLSDGQRTMVYDAENRLVQITKAGNVFTFRYDFRHRLVKQTGTWLTLWDSGSTAQVTSWRFHDGDKVVRRVDQSSLGTQEAEYMWGLDLSGRVDGGDGTGGLLAVMTSDAGYHRPLHDGRGNVWGYPSGTQSNWLATGFLNRLSSFGEVTHVSGAPSNVPYAMLNIGQGTKEFLAEMGLYNYGRRFYDPKNGRFIGRDPISEGGGLNLHGFVQNNPVNGWDYLGQYAIMERTENSVSLTIPIYFGPGVTAEMKAQWIAAIQERWKGEFDGLKVSTTVVEMTELPTAKNRGNTVNILPAARNGISNYGRDPRTGNGILNIYENQATPSTVVHEVGHAMGLKDVYLRKWLNLDTSEYEWHDQNNPPRGKNYVRTSETKTPPEFQDSLMGDLYRDTMSSIDLQALLGGLPQNDNLWIKGPDGLVPANWIPKDRKMIWDVNRLIDEIKWGTPRNPDPPYPNIEQM
jgi:RHS repeat-associated protein